MRAKRFIIRKYRQKLLRVQQKFCPGADKMSRYCSDGYDFQDFREEIVAVLVGFLRRVVEVEPLGVCHAYIGEDHRVEVAHHEVSEQFGVGFGSGYEYSFVYCQTWHEGAFGRSVVDDAFEECLVNESFQDIFLFF